MFSVFPGSPSPLITVWLQVRVLPGPSPVAELQGNRDQAHAGVGRLPGAELRRQRSHVRIVSGAPLKSNTRSKLFGYQPAHFAALPRHLSRIAGRAVLVGTRIGAAMAIGWMIKIDVTGDGNKESVR